MKPVNEENLKKKFLPVLKTYPISANLVGKSMTLLAVALNLAFLNASVMNFFILSKTEGKKQWASSFNMFNMFTAVIYKKLCLEYFKKNQYWNIVRLLWKLYVR